MLKKHLILVLSLCFLTSWTWSNETPDPHRQVKLLAIGNSFSNDACSQLQKFAQAGGKDLLIVQANLSGHSLEQHVSYIQLFEANPNDPKGSPYEVPAYLETGTKKKVSLKELLISKDWTFITIQQASFKSYKTETYEPYAGILINYIHKNAPTAEILVHETWAYREDHSLFKGGAFTQEIMYEKLRSAYEKLAANYKLRIIPSGDAYQVARKLPRWAFTPADPNFDYTNAVEGSLPEQALSLNIGWIWRNDPAANKSALVLDAIHSSLYGQYLISSVWYEMIFGEDVTNNNYVHPKMSADDAAMLRKAAHEAVLTRYPKGNSNAAH